MKIVFLSDIHGNLTALEAVWQDMEKNGFDIALCAGDMVSFGPRPAEVIEFMRGKKVRSILGNHEAVVAGLVPSAADFVFKNDAERDYINNSIKRTRECLNASQMNYIKSLESEIHMPEQSLIVTHSVPDMFVYPDMESMNCFMREREERYLFYGHTHKPGMSTLESGKLAVNIPSVGKPKNGDYWAGYCIAEISSGKLMNLQYCYIEYDVQTVRNEIIKRGFPKETLQFLL